MSVNPFQNVVGHAAVKRVLEHALERPHHAYLLVGGDGLGANALAERFVRALVGMDDAQSLVAHPDVAVLAREEGEGAKTQISVEAVRELRSRVMRRPVVAQRVVAFLPQADRLNEAGANALLKCLEEPPADAVFVLVAEEETRLPATIRSRSATFRLAPVASAEIETWLASRKTDASLRKEAVRVAAGHPGRALRWIEDAEERQREAEAAQTADALLTATDPGQAIAALDAPARRADAADDPLAAWQSLLDRWMRAIRERWEEYPARALTVANALTSARRRAGGPVSPRVWVELELAQRQSFEDRS